MNIPVIANNKPIKVDLAKGKEVYLCACKHSANPPFCDGTHAQFGSAQVGQEGPGVRTSVDEAPVAKATPEEPTAELIHELAGNGLDKVGHHGPMAAMGVPRDRLTKWDDIQIMAAQFARKPLMEETPVETSLVIGPGAKRPLRLEIPLFVSDMRFGALSEEAKIALARRAELAGTGICSGEGWDAARGAGRERPLSLRVGEREVRLPRPTARQGAGLPFRGRPGRQDGHRRTPAGGQEHRQDRRGPGYPGRLCGGLAADLR